MAEVRQDEAQVPARRDDAAPLAMQAPAPLAVLPVMTPAEFQHAYQSYKAIQVVMDAAMPDAIMTIQGRKFRKKAYWRGLRTPFNLSCECVDERRVDLPDGEWGYEVRYRALAPNGAHADGDGACMASEKNVYIGGKLDAFKTAKNQTVHNVRGHAHTRAFNRAISNLVGFGEVSAEEMTAEDRAPADTAAQDLANKFDGEVEHGGAGSPSMPAENNAASGAHPPAVLKCPVCKVGEVVNQVGKKSKSGKALPAFKCSTATYSKEAGASGCKWVEWDEKYPEKKLALAAAFRARKMTVPQVHAFVSEQSGGATWDTITGQGLDACLKAINA